MTNTRYYIAILFSAFYLSAQGSEGSSAFDFLNLQQSSHAYALGGNNISIVEEDVSLVHNNPALLGAEMDMQIDLSYTYYLSSTNAAAATFAKSAGGSAAWSAGLYYVGYGDMIESNSAGEQLGTFSAKDILFNGGYSHDIGRRWRAGIQAKFAYSAYADYTSLALAVDLGVNYYNPNNQFSASMVAKNLGGQLKRFSETYDKLPWDIQFGLSKTMRSIPIRWSVTLQNFYSWSLPYTVPTTDDFTDGETLTTKDTFVSNFFRHTVFGVEYVPDKNFYLSMGYNYKTYSDMLVYGRNILSGFTFGGGINVRMTSIGVSVANRHKGGTVFMFNLALRLNDIKR